MWNPTELAEARDIVHGIDKTLGCRAKAHHHGGSSSIVVRTSEAARFRTDLRCFDTGLIIRHVSSCLGFDEHWPFQWRLEHKLVQALVMQHYCPRSVPITRGLGREALKAGQALRPKLMELFPCGYYIKPALGFASRDRGQGDQTESILLGTIDGASLMMPTDTCDLAAEAFIVQEKLDIQAEYRIHSIYSRVIDDLTFLRYERGHLPANERVQPNLYMQSVLDNLPVGMFDDSIIGWDVAQLRDGRFVVVEANLSGFHPVFERGFHCSGYFLHPVWGPVLTARLVRHLERHEDVRIHIEPDLQDGSAEAETYFWTRRWKDLLTITGTVAALKEDVQEADNIIVSDVPKRPGWHRRFYAPLETLAAAAFAFEDSIPPRPPKKAAQP